MNNFKNSFFRLSCILCVVLFVGCDMQKDQTPWITLFDGTSLTGWSQKGGEAIYTVRDGEIVGTTVHDTPNSFLVTDSIYSDFILELEFLVDPSMNSGIQIRSFLSSIA